MLVSSIAQFDAINSRNNAVYSNIQASSAMMNTLRNIHSFNGEQNLAFLHNLDNHFSLVMLKNSLIYKIACLQEQMFSKMQKKEFEQAKKSINYIA